MSIAEKLLSFKHYDIVSIVLFIFIIIKSGALKQLTEQGKKEYSSRKLYPELTNIYRKYFRGRQGFNPDGAVLANEPLYVSNGGRFIWNYKISFPFSLLYLSILLTAFFFAGVISASFLFIKHQVTFSYIFIYIILSMIGIFIQKKLKETIHRHTEELHNEVSNFLQSHNLTFEDVYIPPINDSNPLISKSFFFTLWGTMILVGLFFTFYYMGF